MTVLSRNFHKVCMHLCCEEKALAILHFSKSGGASLCQMFGEQNSDFQDLRSAAKAMCCVIQQLEWKALQARQKPCPSSTDGRTV